jgi:hypothetical protein
MLAGEVHRGGDVGAALRQHRVRAGLRGPGIRPAEGLGQGGIFPDVEGIRQVLEQLGARRAAGIGRRRDERRDHLYQTPVDALAEGRPLRWAGPARLAGPDTRYRLRGEATRGGDTRPGGGETGNQRQRSQRLQYRASLHFPDLRVVGNRVRRHQGHYDDAGRTPSTRRLSFSMKSGAGRSWSTVRGSPAGNLHSPGWGSAAGSMMSWRQSRNRSSTVRPGWKYSVTPAITVGYRSA